MCNKSSTVSLRIKLPSFHIHIYCFLHGVTSFSDVMQKKPTVNIFITSGLECLDLVMPNSQLQCAGDHVHIVCAVCNAYPPPLVASSSDDTELAEKLKKLNMKVSNHLQKKVLDEKLVTRRAVWQKMEEEALEDFPKLSDSQLQDLTLGIYQIKQAKSYTQEHMSAEGKYISSTFIKKKPV